MKIDLADIQKELRRRKGKKVVFQPSSRKKAPKTPQTPKTLVEVIGEVSTSAQADLQQGSAEQRVITSGEVERRPPFEEEEEENFKIAATYRLRVDYREQ